MERATPPFFVVGQPRSGTKMLRELLNASPDIWISDVESSFIPRVTREIARHGDLERRENFERLTAALRETRAFWYWERRGVHVDDDVWYDACDRYDWPGVLTGLFRCVYAWEMGPTATPWERTLWGDKTPRYMIELPLLAELFPASRFVHIVRDVRDCALSAEKAWGNTPLRTAQTWSEQVRRCRTDGLALGPARYLELRYEDLVADAPATLQGVFEFLGVPTPADAGRLARVPENVGSARGKTEVVANSGRKWAREMAPPLRRRVEAVAGDLLDAFGYEREHPDVVVRPLGAVAMLGYRVVDAWRQLRFRRRELGGWIAGLRFLLSRREPD